jgi:predicted pyridoxine 5'-phosphate oxidase superfamily flavin-nucleotide-binding protein
MPRAFTDIAFTDSVKAAQSRYQSRARNARLEQLAGQQSELGEREMQFISERDSFYLATVAENGWPYIQHRGGPAGFLHVLDSKTIVFADFGGNSQYLSVGNLAASDKVALILLDYPRQQRVKIWGHARIVEPDDDSALFAALALPNYRAKIERAIVIDIAAWDWNCPQHITPRYTVAEIKQFMAAAQ